MSDLIVRNVHKRLGALAVLKGASFSGSKGQIVALLGASGSGKTTLLRCIAGLETPEKGKIEIGGTKVLDADSSLILPPERRDIGLVFQSYALWPHRTVKENVAFGLQLRGVPSSEANARVVAMLEKLGLAHLADRYPFQLSGGQQQRVAICRALVYNPKVLLLDEPLSNLDAKLREEARFWIRKLILDLEICAVMVTHDQGEALAMADKILLLKDGHIIQEGSPKAMYSAPETFYAAEFLGTNNIITGHAAWVDGDAVRICGNGWELDGVSRGDTLKGDADAVKAVIRVEALAVSERPTIGLKMSLEASMYLGDRWEHRLRMGDLVVRAYGPDELSSPEVWCTFPQERLWVFPAESP
ncbi:ABC transporter ATP-binding protein [Microvirga puerhi]|uniref:ABC transporter ATP-binding protein n=1 Tax=Microvirga puerhi TaxID=2876078 RepID=A0ABS7VK32_9HYPH|nr:ABC transporter ATP-binding protein [Microvirga puerhi]MBZ6075890.1 ABC transporter ATP-binding protein [Microvirga puerhi]